MDGKELNKKDNPPVIVGAALSENLNIRAEVDGEDLGWFDVPIGFVKDIIEDEFGVEVEEIKLAHTHEVLSHITFAFIYNNRMDLIHIKKKIFDDYIN